MSDINSVVLCGRVVRDAEVKYTNGGTAVAEISIAVNRYAGQGKPDEVGFFEINIWGKQAEAIKQYLTKGRQVVIQGELRQERWEKDGQKQSKVRINANNVQLVGGKDEKQEPARQSAPQQTAKSEPVIEGPEMFADGEIPF
jgi:single-strand DNA-binding protein